MPMELNGDSSQKKEDSFIFRKGLCYSKNILKIILGGIDAE
jgi:hypothetical protein